jgi:hypothetical protein
MEVSFAARICCLSWEEEDVMYPTLEPVITYVRHPLISLQLQQVGYRKIQTTFKFVCS